MDNPKAESMLAIQREVEQLHQSPLYEYRTANSYQPVIGAGSLNATIVFIGEAPGKQEALSGEPFVGASGKVLDELLASINLVRDDVYITNVVKDRPPDNRDPRPAEIDLYAPFLVRQLALIQPQVIATLGRFAMDFVLKLFSHSASGGKISQLHGQPLPARTSYGEIRIVPLYHPAVALYRRSQRQVLEDDFQQLNAIVVGLAKPDAEG